MAYCPFDMDIAAIIHREPPCALGLLPGLKHDLGAGHLATIDGLTRHNGR